MEITLLGSGCAIPDPERGAPGIAVTVGDRLVLLDCGSGCLHRGVRYGVPVERVEGVLLTHLHPDHTGDLVPLLFGLRNPEVQRSLPLTLAGPEGICPFVAGLEAVYGDWVRPRGYRLELLTLDGRERLDLGPCTIRTLPVPHGPPALAYEITGPGGRRMVYSGDTGYCGSLAAFAREADLLILECSFPEGEERPGHLTPSAAGRMAQEAGCRRLLLTHFYPACRGRDLRTPCSTRFAGPVILGEDGMKLTV